MEDDDADFTPTPNSSSNLASLFGYSKNSLQGNPSLTYTAPKAPKSPAKKSTDEKSKAKIIFSKVVQAYKLENGNYVTQGVIGIVISGNHESHIYEIILYKASKEHLCQIRIFRGFSVTLSENNYASFYDNNKQHWSIMFHSNTDVEQFATKLAICKFYCSPDASNIVIQDLTVLSWPRADVQSTVEITYQAYALNHEEVLKIKEDVKEKIKLSNHKFTPLSKWVIGCSENSKRVIIIPYSLCGNWSSEINSNQNLLLDVRVDKVLSESNAEPKPRLSDDGRESPIDSSSEETSIKARGASIQEALTTAKSQKANLISRMARMGQISLPLKQTLSAGPSDSEEEAATTTSSQKLRLARSRMTTASQSLPAQNPEPSQQLTVYQSDLACQPQISQMGVAYQQLIPVSASAIPTTSTDPNLSVYVSESRVQAAELRMGMSKISEKLDLVWNKVQNMSSRESETVSKTALLDSGGILSSIKNLLTENEGLKTKVEEQKGKIEQQNDKIFQLLELNHKYLEQNTTSHDKQSANESKLRAEMESLRLKEAEVQAEKKNALERIRVLEGNLANAEDASKELKRKLHDSLGEVEKLRKNLQEEDRKKEVEGMNEKLSKASDAIVKLKERLREVIGENEKLNSVIKVQREEIESGSQEMKDSKMKEEEYEREVEKLKKQISVEELKTESRVESLSKEVARLEEENKNLKGELEKRSHWKDPKWEEIVAVLRGKFPDSKDYSSSEILTAVENVFTEAMNGTLEPEKESVKTSKEAPVVPAPRVSLQNAKENSTKVAEMKSAEEETMGKEGSRYKSYDQSWRTTKPPPPPLFDDEDDDEDWLN